MEKKRTTIHHPIFLTLLGLFFSSAVGLTAGLFVTASLLKLIPPAPLDCSGNGLVPCLSGFEIFNFWNQSVVIGLVSGMIAQIFYFRHFMYIPTFSTIRASILSTFITMLLYFLFGKLDNGSNLILNTSLLVPFISYPFCFIILLTRKSFVRRLI